jgi:hypothetical protein
MGHWQGEKSIEAFIVGTIWEEEGDQQERGEEMIG